MEVVAREYDSWAPALARTLVRLAGRIHPQRAREWKADVISIQSLEGASGLWEASYHLSAAPLLSYVAFGRWLHRTVTRRHLELGDIDVGLAAGRRYFPPEHVTWLRGRAEEAGSPYDQAENVLLLTEPFVVKPRAVTFVLSCDGTMCGFTIDSGDRMEAVCVAASHYARYGSTIERLSEHIAVVEDETMEEAARLAWLTANFFGLDRDLPLRAALTLEFDDDSYAESWTWGIPADAYLATIPSRTFGDSFRPARSRRRLLQMLSPSRRP